MRVSAPHKTLVKAAIMTILLTGLLFSNGEGIRLLPFPMADQTACESEKFAAAADAGYQENVTRFEKRQEASARKKDKTGTETAAVFTSGISLGRSTLIESDYIFPQTHYAHYAARKHASDLNSRPPPIS